MHTNSISCPKIFPPSAPVFALVITSDMHFESESGKRAKKFDFYTGKNIQIQATPFRYFQTNSYKVTSNLFTVVWPRTYSYTHQWSLAFSPTHCMHTEKNLGCQPRPVRLVGQWPSNTRCIGLWCISQSHVLARVLTHAGIDPKRGQYVIS